MLRVNPVAEGTLCATPALAILDATRELGRCHIAPAQKAGQNGRMELIFFDVPVYRLPREKYEVQREASIPKEVAEMKEVPDIQQQWLSFFRQKYGGPWQFNEVIGFIRLHFLGTQIRGEWWRVDKKKVTRSRTKRFEFRDWKVADEQDIPPGCTNAEIYALIMAYLARARAEKHIKCFHVDTSVFERIGPYVEWNGLLKKANE